ncbi:MAG: UDP-3-O-(3-hydroxymyristoyl)glucosamine N-acyltransferase [Planctomycetes bacterium]|nr:UDP-3-O-(3-hydroxymyristoyl)glucosamine N-acyltransferase [Planctomycetota bacterium]
MKAAQLAQICGCKLEGNGDVEISNVALIDKATPADVAFAGAPEYVAMLDKSKAGAVLVKAGVKTPEGMTVLRADDPDVAFSKAIAALRPAAVHPGPGISDKAAIGKNFSAAEGVSVGAFASIGNNVKLGKGVIVYPNVFIGDDVEIGDGTIIYPNVTVLYRCRVGKKCILWPGAVIGRDGFGFHFVAGHFEGAPQRGTVVLEDYVEIGANTTVDRARFDVTLVRNGAKIDNLVQVAHNCVVGQHCAIAGHVGLSGSVTLKDYVVLGGGVGIADHITVGMGAKVAAKSGIMRDIPPGTRWAGYPADEGRAYMKRDALSRRLPETMERIRALEKQVAELRALAGKTSQAESDEADRNAE